jgi:hypothetical protein
MNEAIKLLNESLAIAKNLNEKSREAMRYNQYIIM